ncbi:MAG: alpha/beta hydrolase [Brachymonas sp.]|nr:alpha/beta hydrolase [Brachymonas sp.]
MNEPSLNFLDCDHAGSQPGTHRMAYWSHGNPHHEHVIVCVHGLSRQGRDFDELAKRLIGADGMRCRVVAVDVAGRGMSEWLCDPALYQVPQYAADLVTLLFALQGQGARMVDWVGTSMGGLIGIAVSAQTALTPALKMLAPRKLVLNDVGPVVQWSALQRIKDYIGADLRFATEQEAIDAMWKISTSFGPHTPEQWRALCLPMIRPDGKQFKLHYDPAIAVPIRAATRDTAAQGEALLWQLYDAIKSQTLLVRGKESDLISQETAHHMQTRGPRAKLVEFAGVGHAPTLVQDDQVDAVEAFLFA